MKTITKLWILIAALAVLAPIGLFLPKYFNGGAAAWGEWSIEEIGKLLGYVPKGMERLSSLWSSPIPGYLFKGWKYKSSLSLSLAYIFSAAAGVLITAGIVFLIGKFFSDKK